MRVFVSARPDEPYLCTIDWISPVLDAGTRSVRIRGRIDNADHRLLADMYARIEVTLDPGEGSIVVPSSAVVCNENGQQVMVVASRQGDRLQLETRAVRAEPIDSTHARILSGLSAGEWIVPRGALGLSEELAADR
jgi:membrane fusion protein (multidrug efflux system)